MGEGGENAEYEAAPFTGKGEESIDCAVDFST